MQDGHQDQQYQLTFVAARKPRWSALATSFFVQAIVLVILIEVGLIKPKELVNAVRYHNAIDLSLDVPTARPDPPQQVLRKAPPPRPELDRYFDTAALRAPTRIHVPSPKEEVPQIQLPKQIRMAAIPPTPVAKPAPIVQTGTFSSATSAPPNLKAPPSRNVQTAAAFSSGSSATPTLKNLASKDVQTGGFGDPNGIKGIGKGNAKVVAAAMGSFDLPGGPGNGNGTGGSRGARGTIASAGFGNGVATSNPGNLGGGSLARGAIQQTGFGDARPAEQTRIVRAAATPSAPKTTPVQILSKPTPVYTEEARSLRLEGDVVLQVLFTAAGEARVSRVVRGLGHGLDEAAARAATQIKFRPAVRDGQAVDSMTLIHVVFQLAY